MIRFEIENTTPEMLSAAKARIQRGAFTGLKRALVDLQGYIKLKKLQGQVLRHVTGKGAASVRVLPPTEGPRMEGFVAAGGGPAFYMAVHEFGGLRDYEIRPKTAKALAWPTGGTAAARYKVGRMISLKAKQRAAVAGGVGMAFAKVVHHPKAIKRSFMRTGSEERAPRSAAIIAESIRQEIS